MTELQATKRRPASRARAATGRLFVLELNAGRIHSMNPDGSDRKTIVTNCHLPDGIVVDAEAGHIYWTNMGVPNLDDGSIERADIDGGNRRVIVPQGVTHTPKQIHLDKENGKLYWCDREGMRVMRANLDGSHVETLVETGRGDSGPARSDPVVRRNHHRSEASENLLDAKRPGQRRPGPYLPRQHRHSQGREPDEPLRHRGAVRSLAGTDRPRARSGRTASSIGPTAAILRAATPSIARRSIKRRRRRSCITHLMEGIGIALDVPGNRMFVTDFAGSVYSADLDGKNERNFLYAQGNLTGIAYAEI